DTETASRAGWAWLYREHGHVLPPEKWALMVGTVGGWDPMGHLEQLTGEALEWEALNARRSAHELTLLEAEELRPGLADYPAAAREAGVRNERAPAPERLDDDKRCEDRRREQLEQRSGTIRQAPAGYADGADRLQHGGAGPDREHRCPGLGHPVRLQPARTATVAAMIGTPGAVNGMRSAAIAAPPAAAMIRRPPRSCVASSAMKSAANAPSRPDADGSPR